MLLSTGQGVLGHNSYAYCGNNTTARIDSDGLAYENLYGDDSYALAGTIGASIGLGVLARFTHLFSKSQPVAQPKTRPRAKEKITRMNESILCMDSTMVRNRFMLEELKMFRRGERLTAVVQIARICHLEYLKNN